MTHYDDVIMTTMAPQTTSLTVVYSTVYSDADQRKHQSSASLAFVWGIHRDRWIPRTKDQLRGKCFHLMTSSWCCSVNSFSLRWKNAPVLKRSCIFLCFIATVVSVALLLPVVVVVVFMVPECEDSFESGKYGRDTWLHTTGFFFWCLFTNMV